MNTPAWQRLEALEELEELCAPLAEYLRRAGNPYAEIHVSLDELKVTSVECAKPLDKNGG